MPCKLAVCHERRACSQLEFFHVQVPEKAVIDSAHCQIFMIQLLPLVMMHNLIVMLMPFPHSMVHYTIGLEVCNCCATRGSRHALARSGSFCDLPVRN